MSRTQELRIIHGDGHVTQASYDNQRCRSLPRSDAGWRLARCHRSPSLLRQFGHQWRRANHRKPPRRASAIGQSLRFLIAHSKTENIPDVRRHHRNPADHLPAVSAVAGRPELNGEDALQSGILGMLLSVKEYGAVMPWLLGMVIAIASVRERIRHRRMA